MALLATNAPLMPLQGFAIGFSAFALANLAVLWIVRKRFRFPPARVTAAAGPAGV